jgi:hypothetical protein
LPQEGVAELEERLLTDGSFYEELLIAEDELVDQSLKGELTQPESEAFTNHFLRAPEHQQKLRFARTLRKMVAEKSQADLPIVAATGTVRIPEPAAKKRALFSFIQTPAMGLAFAAIVLVIVVGASWFVIRNWRSAEPRPQDLLTEVLTPGQTRDIGGDGFKRFSIPADKGTLRLQLILTRNEYPTYLVILQNIDSTVILSRDGLKAQSINGQPTIVVDAASRSLSPGDYQVKISGVTASGDPESLDGYFFRVLGR